jgi:hypothetical protein
LRAQECGEAPAELRFPLRQRHHFIAAAQNIFDPGPARGAGGDGRAAIEAVRAAILVAFRGAAPLFHRRCALRVRRQDLNCGKCATPLPLNGASAVARDSASFCKLALLANKS